MQYFVSIQYGTRSGNFGAWSGHVSASDINAALSRATDRIRKRKTVARIFGGDAVPVN